MEEQQWRNEFVALDAPPTVQTSTTQPAPVKPPRRRIPWKWVIIVVAFILSLIIGLLLLRSVVGKKSTSGKSGATTKSQDVDLGSLSDVATPLKVDNTDKVVINGVLETNQGLVINPTGQPTTAILGQLYVDSATRELRFYNGEGYQTVATTGSTLSTQDVLNLIGANALALPQDLSKTASPQFTGMTLTSVLKIGGTILQGANGGSSTFTLPSNTGSANQCLTTDGAGTLSFASCASGSGNAFLQGGNAFATAANLGTTDANSLNFLTNNTARMTITATGNIGINNTSSDNKLAINVPTTVDNAAQLLVATNTSTNKGIVIQGEFAQTGSLIEAQDYNGSALFTVGGNGVSAFRTGTNSTTGFQVQNASGTSVLNVDTTNQRIGIGYSNPSYKLDVNGDVNIVGTSALRIGGAVICTASGCAASGSSGFYIQNSTGVQSNANFAIQSANAGYVAGLIRGAVGQTANLLNLQVSNGTNVLAVGATGSVLAQNSSNSTTAFQIQDAAGTSNLFTADTVNNRIGIGIVPNYKLDINGDANIEASSALRIGGTVICTIDGCVGTSSSANNFIQNTTGVQSNANFSIQSANATYVGGVIKGAVGQTADLLNLRNSAGANLFGVSATGALTLQNSSDSTSAFSVNDSAGTSHVLVVDTVNKRVGINQYPTGYALDVNGDVNLDNSGSLRINGNVVCSLSGCSASSGSGNYIQNGNGIQTNGNFAIQSANIGYVGGLIRGASGQTADIFQVQNSSASNMFRIGATGAVTSQNSADSSAAFNINNAGGTTIFNVDTQGGTTNATNLSGNAIVGTTSNSSSYGVIGTQYAGVGGGVKGVGGGGYGVLGQSASNASGFFQTTDTSNLNTVATLIAKAQTNQSTANVFEVQNSSGTSVLGVSATGAVLAKNSTDSTTAFQIQNAAGNNYLLVNTSGAAVSLGNTGIASTVQIGNTTGAVAQTINIGNNTTASSSTTVNIGSSIGTSQTTIKAGTSGVLIQPANGANGFQIQNSSGAQLFNLDTSNAVLTVNGAGYAETQAWATTQALLQTRYGSSTFVSGPYIYSVGGVSGSDDSIVSFATLQANGTIGTWSNTSASLSLYGSRAYYPGAASFGNYVYISGGFDDTSGTGPYTPSYSTKIGKLGSNGDITSWYTTSYRLNTAVAGGSVITAKGYIYILGGSTCASNSCATQTPAASTGTTVVQYAKIYPDGTIGSFTASSNTLPVGAGLVGGRAIYANGRIYYVGGLNTSGAAQTSIYYATVNDDGTIGSWSTNAVSLPAGRAYHGLAALSGNLYVFGGGSSATSGNNTVYYAPFNSNGSVGSASFTTSTNALTNSVSNFGYAAANGYMYVLGGYTSSAVSTTQYTSTARIKVGASLDLVGVSGQNMNDNGLGGSLTAGNTNIVGRFSVTGQSDFLQGVSIRNGMQVMGDVAFRAQTDNAGAFILQSASGANLIQLNTIDNSSQYGYNGVLQAAASPVVVQPTKGASYFQYQKFPTLSMNNGAFSQVFPNDGLPVVVAVATNGPSNWLVVTKCNKTDCSTTGSQIDTLSTSNIPTYTQVSTTGVVTATGGTNNGLPVIVFKDNSVTPNKLVAWNCGSYDCTAGNSFTVLASTTTPGGNMDMIMGPNQMPLIINISSTNNRPQLIRCTNNTGNNADTCRTSTSVQPWTSSEPELNNHSLTGQISVAITPSDQYPILVSAQNNTNGANGKDGLFISKCNDANCTSHTNTLISYYATLGGTYDLIKPVIMIGGDGLPIIGAVASNNQLFIVKCKVASCATYNTPKIAGPVGQVATSNLDGMIGGDQLPVFVYKDNTGAGGVGIYHCGSQSCDPATTGSLANTQTEFLSAKSNGGQQGTPIINNLGFPSIAFYAGTSTGSNDWMGVLNCVDYTCYAASTSSWSGGVSLGGNYPFANINVVQINSGQSGMHLYLDSSGKFTSNALSSDSSNNVSVQSPSSTAFTVIDTTTNNYVLSVDSANNAVNIGTRTSVTGYGLQSTYANLFRNSTNSTSQFAIQNSSSASLMNVDSTNNRINLFSALSAVTTPTPTATKPSQNATPTVTPTGTTGATSYSYIIEAVGTIGNSAASAAGTTATGNATLSSTNYNALSWTAFTPSSGSVLYYKIYRTVGGSTIGLVGTTTGTTFNDTGYTGNGASITAGGNLTASTTYYYKITAIDGTGGESAASTETSVATDTTLKTIDVSWSAVSGAVAYKVYRSTATGTEVYLTTVQTNSFTDVGSITAGSTSPPSSNSAYTSANNSNSALQLVIGGNGTPTGQLYVSGTTPSSAAATVATGSFPNAVAVQGRYAYVTNQTSATLQVIDVSSPSNPAVVGSVSTGTTPTAVSVADKYAYVINQTSNTLQVFDISKPSTPSLSGSVAVGTAPRGLAVQGRYAYVSSTTSNTLQVYDISNPASPIAVGVISTGTGSSPIGLNVAGRYAYVVNTGTSTMQIYDIATAASPSLLGTVTVGATPYRVAIQGRYAYVTNFTSSTMQVIDVSNPATPLVVGSVNTGTNPRGLTVQGRYAYVANATSNTITIYDVSNPANPTLLSGGTITTGSIPYAIVLNGRYAYVPSASANLLQIYDMGGTYTQSLEAGTAELGGLQVSGNTVFSGSASVQGGFDAAGSIQTAADLGVAGNAWVQGNLRANNLSVAGSLQGGLTIANLATPGTPTVTTVGTTGASTWGYKVVAVTASGATTAASSQGTTTSANGAATLTTANYQRITWSTVSGAVSYKIYRTAVATSPATTGLIGTTAATTFDDTGITGDGTVAPTADTSTAFQVQNASGTQILNVDTVNSKVVIGQAGTASSQLAFGTTGGGTITIAPTSTASNFTLTLPAETGTICTTAASANCVNAIGGGLSGSFLAKNPTSAETSTSSINGFQYQMTNSNTGTSAGVLNLQGTSTTAFQIQNAAGSTTLLVADTANNVIRPGFAPSQASTTNTFTNIDTTGTVGQYTKTAIGSDGLPIIVYTDVTNNAIKVAKCSNATCSSSTKTTIASGLTTPASNFLSGSIAVDPTGKPYVVYSTDSGNNNNDILYIVRCGNAACSSGNSSPVAIDSLHGKGYQDIAIGSDGLPVISYGYGGIDIIKCGNTACNSGNTTTLSVASGLEHAIKVDSSGLPFLSVYNSTNGDLLAVSCGTKTCASGNTTTTIDNSSSIIGKYNSVAIPSDDKPVISYYDAQNGNLRIAKCSNTTCTSATKTTLDSTGSVGYYTSVVVGTSGQPVISYYDLTNGDLKVYQCSNSTCTSGSAASIDTTNDVGQYTSIVLPSDGQPFISYYDNTSANLRTVKCSDASCSGAGTALSGVDLGNVSTQFRSVYFTTLNLNSGSSHLTLDEAGNLVSNGLTAASDNTVVVSADSSTAFVVQSTAGTALLSANTTTGALTLGTTTGTGTITIGQSTQNQTINIGTGAVASGKTLNINIGNAGLAGSTINVTIGSAAAGGALTVNSDATFNGTLKAAGHILSANASGTTTVALNANCGTGCTVTINGNDTAGLITINTGTTPAAGAQATVTFAVAYVSAPTIAITPNTVPASSNFPQYYYTSTTTTFDLNSYNALTASKTYTFSYHIVQR